MLGLSSRGQVWAAACGLAVLALAATPATLSAQMIAGNANYKPREVISLKFYAQDDVDCEGEYEIVSIPATNECVQVPAGGPWWKALCKMEQCNFGKDTCHKVDFVIQHKAPTFYDSVGDSTCSEPVWKYNVDPAVDPNSVGGLYEDHRCERLHGTTFGGNPVRFTCTSAQSSPGKASAANCRGPAAHALLVLLALYSAECIFRRS